MDTVNNGLPVSSLKMTPALYEPAVNEMPRTLPESSQAKSGTALADKLNLSQDARNALNITETKTDPIQPHLSGSAPVNNAQGLFKKSIDAGIPGSSPELKEDNNAKGEEGRGGNEENSKTNETSRKEELSGYYISLPQKDMADQHSSDEQERFLKRRLDEKFGLGKSSQGKLVNVKIY